jgi:multiple sugar transport system substrate-binding protein
MSKRIYAIASLLIAILMVATTSGVGHISADEPVVVLWTKFNDQNTTDPNSQDKWVAQALKDFTAKTGKGISHIVQPYDQINSKLNLAVQSKGDVPDVSYIDTQNLPFFIKNGTLQDITAYVKAAPWFKDVTPGALATCTAPDGKIYCVPTSVAGASVYYWKDLYPNGFPKTAQELLTAARDLKKKDAKKFGVTFKGSEGISLQVTWFPLVTSAGGQIADPATGKAAWANDKVAEVVKWARTIVAEKHAPEVVLATGFDSETPFMNGEAAGFLAGSWSYVYLNPLTSPDGAKFDFKSESVSKAADAGELGFAPPLAWEGGKPALMVTGTAYAIPVGAKNPQNGQAWIDFQLGAGENAKFASAYGGIPTLNEALKDAMFQTAYWKAMSENLTTYAQNPPALTDYDKGIAAFTDTINKLLVDPSLDIMKELQASQDNYNNGLK